MRKQRKKPCYEISYIKVTIKADGKPELTVKLVNKATKKSGK